MPICLLVTSSGFIPKIHNLQCTVQRKSLVIWALLLTIILWCFFGMANHVSASTWFQILHELHVQEHDLCELQYLHIWKELETHQHLICHFQNLMTSRAMQGSIHLVGISPIYMDYMQHICPVLDQCMAALIGYVIKWDHSFKLPKYLMKLDGVAIFLELFTVGNKTISMFSYSAKMHP